MHCTTFRLRNHVTTLWRAPYTWCSQPSGKLHYCFAHGRSPVYVQTLKYYTVYNVSRQIPSLYLKLGQAASFPTHYSTFIMSFNAVSSRKHCYSHIILWKKLGFNLLATDFFFQILAHLVFKMRVIQKPNKVALWNKRHFEEKKMEIIQRV